MRLSFLAPGCGGPSPQGYQLPELRQKHRWVETETVASAAMLCEISRIEWWCAITNGLPIFASAPRYLAEVQPVSLRVGRFHDRTGLCKHPPFDLPHTLRTNSKLPRDCREGKSRASELCHLALTYGNRESLVCVHEINFRPAELRLLLGFQPRREFSTALFLRLCEARTSPGVTSYKLSLSPGFVCKHVQWLGDLGNASLKADFGSTSIFRGDSENPCAV